MFSTDAAGQIITPGQYAQPVFPGQLQTCADLYYNRYRDYDPTTGRYIQADPIGLAGGPNPYGYANANPMRYIDPEGLYFIQAARGAYLVGAALGTAGALLWKYFHCPQGWNWGGGPSGGTPPSAPPTFEPAGGNTPDPGFDDGYNPLPPFYGLPPQAPPLFNKPPSDAGNSDAPSNKPPTGSKPIDQTPWSGDHGRIKDGIKAGGADNVKISPNGNVWRENRDGSWTNHGPAGDFTGSGKPSGRRGKDRG